VVVFVKNPPVYSMGVPPSRFLIFYNNDFFMYVTCGVFVYGQCFHSLVNKDLFFLLCLYSQNCMCSYSLLEQVRNLCFSVVM
jgi:uncharacterized membrane protein